MMQRLILGVGLRDEALDLPEAVQRRAERLTILCIPVHLLDTTSRDAQAHGGQHHLAHESRN